MLRNFFVLVLSLLASACLASDVLKPTAIAVLPGGGLAIANSNARRIDIYAAGDFSKPQVSIALQSSPTAMATSANGKMIYVSTFEIGRNGGVELIDLDAKKVIKRAPAPYGATGIEVSGGKVYIAGQFDDRVAELDGVTLQELRSVKVLREPKSVAVGEKYIFAANFLPAQRADLDYVASDVSVIDRSNFKIVKNIKLTNGSNALRDLILSDDGRYVMISHNLGRYTVPTTQLQQGWMNTSAVSFIDVASLAYLGAVIMDEPNRGAAGTWSIVQGGDKLVVTHSGTHDISVIDFPKLLAKLSNYKGGVDVLAYDLRFLFGIRNRVPIVGNGPRVMAVSADKQRVYIPTYFSDTLNIVDLSDNSVSFFALNPARSETLAQRGEKAFNDATHCFQNWQSCNGCHPGDGRTDGMNWDLQNDGIGNSKNCKSLLFSIQTAPSMISGIRATAELANRKGFNFIQFAEIDEDLAKAVDEYTKTLQPVPSPYLVDGKLSEQAERGRKVFEKLRCDVCHSGPYYTDLKMYRIGADVEFEKGWDTPTLREVWRTAPYLFDGRAATMREVFSVHKHGVERKITDKEIDELTQYVNSL